MIMRIIVLQLLLSSCPHFTNAAMQKWVTLTRKLIPFFNSYKQPFRNPTYLMNLKLKQNSFNTQILRSLWFQQFRIQWIAEEDKTTNFFHRISSIRKANNLIKSLYNANGKWTINLPLIKHIIINYFQNLYTRNSHFTNLISNQDYMSTPTLSPDQIQELDRPISNSEIVVAVKSLSPWKASWLDGFPAKFYQYC